MANFTSEIRQATMEDLPSVLALRHELALSDGDGDLFVDRSWALTHGQEVFESVIKAQESSADCMLIAVQDGDIVGYLEGGRKEPVAWRPVRAAEVRSLFVKDAFRRRGIGRRLIESFLRWSRDQGAEAVQLEVFASNWNAMEFYHRIGFRPSLILQEIELNAVDGRNGKRKENLDRDSNDQSGARGKLPTRI